MPGLSGWVIAQEPVDALGARERTPNGAPCDSGNGGPATVAPHATPPLSKRSEKRGWRQRPGQRPACVSAAMTASVTWPVVAMPPRSGVSTVPACVTASIACISSVADSVSPRKSSII